MFAFPFDFLKPLFHRRIDRPFLDALDLIGEVSRVDDALLWFFEE